MKMENYQESNKILSGILAKFESKLEIVQLYGTSRNQQIPKKLLFAFSLKLVPANLLRFTPQDTHPSGSNALSVR